MSTSRKPLITLLAAITAVGVAGCGDLESSDSSAPDSERAALTEGTTTTPNRPANDLPPRPNGVVEIQGEIDGSIAEEVIAGFPSFTQRSGLAVRAEATSTDEEPGFEALCAGSIDITAASRRITEAELGACADNGLQVIDFQVAFDAIAIVTRNERDTGADCVNIPQLHSMFAAGTAINSWSQLNPNFALLRLETAGPTDQTSDFDYFGSRVLGVADPTLADFRSNYRALARERQVKNFIVKSPPGAVGIVGFSFYELFEEKLRPLEIDGQTGDRCVFPSAETISSELYPLERTLRLYTTVRGVQRPEVETYIRFHLEEAEGIANNLELIPLPDALRESELAKLADPSNAQSSESPEGGGSSAVEDADSSTEATTTEPTTEATTTDPTAENGG